MNVEIAPSSLCGTVKAIPSKSAAHRLLICAALADRPTKILMSGSSADIDATIGCLESLGAKIDRFDDHCMVTPISLENEPRLLNCCESGSTLRFLVPVALALRNNVCFDGTGRLPQRPIDHLRTAMQENGAAFSSDRLPFTISGELKSGIYILPGNVSSQYISGLLFALPLLEGESIIRLSSALESSGYVDMTLSALDAFGINIETIDDGYRINGGQKYISPENITVEGDWSNAAFFLAAGALYKSCTVTGLDIVSGQGDRAIADILEQFGADVIKKADTVTVSPGNLKGQTIDISNIPDLLPILAVTACFAEGESRFINGARLRLKESDRLSSVAQTLGNLGAKVTESEDSLSVYGGSLNGGIIDSFNDHRIVMSAAIAAAGCSQNVTITDAHAVEKSYPTFFDDYRTIGGIVK